LRRALAVREKQDSVNGGDHPTRPAESLTALALVVADRGDAKSAEALYRQSLRIYAEAETTHVSNLLSATHTLDNLAGLLKKQGAYADADALYRRALHI